MAKSNIIPANYRDPAPNPKRMGWGKKTDTDAEKRKKDRKLIESLPMVCAAGDAVGATQLIASIEKTVRAKFMFDSGWDCMVAERLVYKLADLLTLMITQNIGNCVGASHVALLASRIAHEILLIGDPEEPLGMDQLAMPFIPYTYGVGRWVGGMLGPGDGSYCGAQIEGTQKHGFLPCFTPGLEAYDGTLPQASAKVGRKFGSSRAEIEKWTELAKPFDLVEAPVCRSTDDAIHLIEDLKIPLQICSGVMPGGRVDNSLGFPVYTGFVSASHSTQITTSFTFKGRKFFVDRNQWGYKAHLGAPTIGIPPGCLVFPAENFTKWIKKSECIGIGAIKGLESNPGA